MWVSECSSELIWSHSQMRVREWWKDESICYLTAAVNESRLDYWKNLDLTLISDKIFTLVMRPQSLNQCNIHVTQSGIICNLHKLGLFYVLFKLRWKLFQRYLSKDHYLSFLKHFFQQLPFFPLCVLLLFVSVSVTEWQSPLADLPETLFFTHISP